MSEMEKYPGVVEFLFNAPLYQTYLMTMQQAVGLFKNEINIDGHCPYCGSTSTFERTSGAVYSDPSDHYIGGGLFNHTLVITCARNKHHTIALILFLHRLTGETIRLELSKIGQWPSLADIAIDESKTYSRLLSKEDSHELHKAIGLAAHGVGIGSYVYLRRVFEHLIRKRFDEFKGTERWSEDDFKKRMEDKIELLKKHLPPFLVENQKIYSILSAGVHELDEASCLAFFPVLKRTVILILEEDKRKAEELEERKALAAAIAAYKPPDTPA